MSSHSRFSSRARLAVPLTGAVVALSLGSAVLAPSTSGAAGQLDVGMHVAREGDLVSAVATAEQALGRPLGVVSIFKGFTDTRISQPTPGGAPTEEEQLLASGHTVLVSWRATDSGDSATTRGNRATSIAAGNHDATLREMGQSLARLDGRVLLRFQWEMDQEAPGTQYIGTPTAYIAAWRRVHSIVSAIAPNVEWVWSPRANSFNKGVGQQFWPGGAYVDHVGGSAVPIMSSGQEGSWRGPADLFSEVHDFAVAQGKPLVIWNGVREKIRDPQLDPADAEWANDATWKAGYISELRSLATGPWAGQLSAVIWYSTVAPSGFDFRHDTSAASKAAFVGLACDPVVIGSGACSASPSGGGSIRSLPATVTFGAAGDAPMVADWDGDGLDDLIVRRFNNFLIDLDGDGIVDREHSFGRGSEPGIVVDLDRDGRVDPTVFRGDRWVADVGRDGAGNDFIVTFGTASSDRFIGDFDGDGLTDLVSVSGSTWAIDTDLDGQADQTIVFGASSDQRLMANLTRTAGDEPTIARSGYWDVDGKHNGGSAEWRRTNLGGVGIPVAGDFDGDGDDDGGWWRDGVWSVIATG